MRSFLILFLSFYTLTQVAALDDALSILEFKYKADLHNKLPYSVNTTSTHCKWQGVQCQSDGKVVHLVLENLSLAGVFAPNTLTRLDQLRVLSLQSNSLTGPIPNLAGLVNLKTLFLDHNSFSGAIPLSISYLHRLRTLDLSYNKLSGVIPLDITKLDRLNYLRLDSNRFNGSIPPLKQSSLQILNVSCNSLTGPVPVTPTLANFTASSFSFNPGLCGEIVRTECSSIGPFFGKNSTAAPPPPPRVVLGQSTQMQEGMTGFTNSNSRKHKRLALIIGFSAGIVVLISSIMCLLISMKASEKKKRKDIMSSSEIMEMAAAADAAAEVMRMEETNELEEKVKKLQQGMAMGKSGNLVFCAGETQLYTLEQLMRASAELLGRGSVATTYKAVLDNRLIVCVKRLDAGRMAGTTKETFERHMEAVGGLRHPNLVPLRAYFQAKEERLLVYDYQANGSLFSLIHGKAKPLHWTSCLKIAEDVAQGLCYIHQAWRLVHGNLKLSNVLLGSDFEACLSDYCLSALSPRHPEDPAAYDPPEIRKLNHQPTAKSDVYSFGVLLLELLTGKPASEHPHLMADDMVKWVRSARENGAVEAEDRRMMMLVEVAIVCRGSSPEQRPTMWQVLKMIQEVKEGGGVQEEGPNEQK
ncbi:Leucine-rich repeat-containing protein [Cynara cardunculus var. scolymus]|uniref:Leucine-rich repeat-containing protein n=1 Tax=Cynara cardunculus var. scolymus TaxID=59895 RepID=A0A103YCQ4_CYNCS|nr:Leucine-rich repeat-containing protein [Cynara cardunculus var. scolymus]